MGLQLVAPLLSSRWSPVTSLASSVVALRFPRCGGIIAAHLAADITVTSPTKGVWPLLCQGGRFGKAGRVVSIIVTPVVTITAKTFYTLYSFGLYSFDPCSYGLCYRM